MMYVAEVGVRFRKYYILIIQQIRIDQRSLWYTFLLFFSTLLYFINYYGMFLAILVWRNGNVSITVLFYFIQIPLKRLSVLKTLKCFSKFPTQMSSVQ